MIKIAATLIGIFLTMGISLGYVLTAKAGIGPDGFAQYARQGIININNKVYGKGNSPWIVTCTDHPNYQTLSDRVVCIIK